MCVAHNLHPSLRSKAQRSLPITLPRLVSTALQQQLPWQRFERMGADEGFDVYPPLLNTPGDNELYRRFKAAVRKRFNRDPVMKIDDKGDTVFQQGEHPTLTKDGFKFRRFSAKITGSHCENVRYYLTEVRAIAVSYFGQNRVHYWNEVFEIDTQYSRREVYDVIGE